MKTKLRLALAFLFCFTLFLCLAPGVFADATDDAYALLKAACAKTYDSPTEYRTDDAYDFIITDELVIPKNLSVRAVDSSFTVAPTGRLVIDDNATLGGLRVLDIQGRADLHGRFVTMQQFLIGSNIIDVNCTIEIPYENWDSAFLAKMNAGERAKLVLDQYAGSISELKAALVPVEYDLPNSNRVIHTDFEGILDGNNTIYGKDVLALGNGAKLTIPQGSSLTLLSGNSLTVPKDSTLSVAGRLINGGEIRIGRPDAPGGSVSFNGGSYSGEGRFIIPKSMNPETAVTGLDAGVLGVQTTDDGTIYLYDAALYELLDACAKSYAVTENYIVSTPHDFAITRELVIPQNLNVRAVYSSFTVAPTGKLVIEDNATLGGSLNFLDIQGTADLHGRFVSTQELLIGSNKIDVNCTIEIPYAAWSSEFLAKMNTGERAKLVMSQPVNSIAELKAALVPMEYDLPNSYRVIHTDFEGILDGNNTIYGKDVLAIQGDAQITVPSGSSLTVMPEASIGMVDNAVLTVAGRLINGNEIRYRGGGTVSFIGGIYCGPGEIFIPADGNPDDFLSGLNMDKFRVKELGDTISYRLNRVPDLNLPFGLTAIEQEAFVGGDFIFPSLSENTVSIGYRAFADCPRLSYIYIPAATTHIDPEAFGSQRVLEIRGHAGSYAETFAQQHGFIFKDVS